MAQPCWTSNDASTTSFSTSNKAASSAACSNSSTTASAFCAPCHWAGKGACLTPSPNSRKSSATSSCAMKKVPALRHCSTSKTLRKTSLNCWQRQGRMPSSDGSPQYVDSTRWCDVTSCDDSTGACQTPCLADLRHSLPSCL